MDIWTLIFKKQNLYPSFGKCPGSLLRAIKEVFEEQAVCWQRHWLQKSWGSLPGSGLQSSEGVWEQSGVQAVVQA